MIQDPERPTMVQSTGDTLGTAHMLVSRSKHAGIHVRDTAPIALEVTLFTSLVVVPGQLFVHQRRVSRARRAEEHKTMWRKSKISVQYFCIKTFAPNAQGDTLTRIAEVIIEEYQYP